MTPEEALTQEAVWAMRSVSADAKPEMLGEYKMRTANYMPRQRVGQPYQCPRCWVRDGVRAPLRAVPGGDDHDLLRCEQCHTDLVVPFEG